MVGGFAFQSRQGGRREQMLVLTRSVAGSAGRGIGRVQGFGRIDAWARLVGKGGQTKVRRLRRPKESTRDQRLRRDESSGQARNSWNSKTRKRERQSMEGKVPRFVLCWAAAAVVWGGEHLGAWLKKVVVNKGN